VLFNDAIFWDYMALLVKMSVFKNNSNTTNQYTRVNDYAVPSEKSLCFRRK
jgi:hypothetical protein